MRNRVPPMSEPRRNGLRRPSAQISPHTLALPGGPHEVLQLTPAYGFPAGTAPSRVMRRIFPLGRLRSDGLVTGLPAPPSPTVTNNVPSLATRTSPPLWFEPHSGMLSSSTSSELGFTVDPVAWNRETRFFAPPGSLPVSAQLL